MKKVTLVLLILVIFLSGCSEQKINQVTKAKAVPKDMYIFGGKIQADTSASVSSKINAKVMRINVDVGSKVSAGEPIIQLDTSDIEAQLRQAETSVGTAQANLNKIKAGSRPEQIASAKASVDGAKVSLDIAQKNYDREKILVASGSSTQSNLDQVCETLSGAKTQYEADLQNLTMLQNGSTQTDINAVAATVVQAQSAVDSAKVSLSYGTITAPISGVVTVKNINVGEMSGVGQSLVTIVSSSQFHIDSYVPEDLLSQVRVGNHVNVKMPEVPGKVFDGEILTIDEQINSQNKDSLVKVSVKDDSDILKSGMFAEIGLKK